MRSFTIFVHNKGLSGDQIKQEETRILSGKIEGK